MDGVKIYDARIRGGKSLAKSYPVEADLVTGVPGIRTSGSKRLF